jgi:Prokaryotic membrane lipoprotein lipid attachment site
MKKLGYALFVIVLTLIVSGCGSDKDRGVNKDKDRPIAAKDADQ